MCPPSSNRRAQARNVPERPWKVVAFGIDTVSFAWRGFDAHAAADRLANNIPHPETGEVLPTRRKGGSAWVTDEATGARIGLTQTPLGHSLLWCEARLAPLLGNTASDHSLATPDRLSDGAAVGAALARRLELLDGGDGGTTVRRLDLAADVEFARSVDGAAFLQAMANLDCPGYKRVPIHARGSSNVENVEWRTPKTFKVVMRCYDKGVEAGTASSGRLIRVERQLWVPSADRVEPSQVSDAYLARTFQGPLAAWGRGREGVTAVGPYDACALLREKVGKASLGGPPARPRHLTARVAERMAGTIGVLSVAGDDWYPNRRTAQRRRAELRKIGIEFVTDLPAGVRVDVGSVIRAMCEAWAGTGNTADSDPHVRTSRSRGSLNHAATVAQSPG